MKTLLITSTIICSSIAATVGFFAGRLTAPIPQGDVAIAYSEYDSALPKSTPTQPALPLIEDISTDAAEPVTTISEPVKFSDNDFSERAALPMQTLTDIQGRKIQAKILEVNKQQVKIRKNDGREYRIPLSNLSEIDIAFCEYLSKNDLKSAKTAKSTKDSDIDWDAIFGS